MTETAKKRATYEDLYSIPGNMIGEIIKGKLTVTLLKSDVIMNHEL